MFPAQVQRLPKISDILAMLLIAYPNAPVTPGTFPLYERMLSDLPVEALETAVLQWIATSKFFPTVAELRECAFRLAADCYQHPSPAEAYGLVVAEIRRIGIYGQPKFQSDLVAKTVKYMGWREICSSEEPQIVRAQFLKMYEQLQQREIEDAKLIPAARRLKAGGEQKVISPGEKVQERVLSLAEKMAMED